MKKLHTLTYQKRISYFLIFLMLIQLQSCQYFMIKSVEPENLPRLSQIGEIYKRFILHSGDQLFELSDISVDEFKISGQLSYPKYKIYYKEGRSHIITKGEDNILNEVHIYLKASNEELIFGPTSIPIHMVDKIMVIKEDASMAILSVVGGVVGIFVIIGVIALLTKSSCPFVYAYNGTDFVFEGETFGGAIGDNFQRDDYVPLPSLKAKDGVYKIRISNELKERQYTDLAHLLVVEHPAGTRVLLDKNGKAHLLGQEVLPVDARSYNGTSLKAALQSRDEEVFFFNDEEFSQNGVYLSFKRPVGQDQGNLVLKAQNTLWGDYLMGTFFSKFGNRFEGWMEKQSKIPASERRQQLLDSQIPLFVYLKQDGAWKLLDYVNPIGPLAYREIVVPIDFSGVNEETIELKLETGFMFWQMDYAAMDFTADARLKINQLNPMLAMGTGDINWTASLKQLDGQYMAQETPNQFTEITYPAIPIPKGMTHSMFLHASGYYELIREFQGPPQIRELIKFKTPGYFSDYSRAEYFKFLGKDELVAGF